MKLERYPFFDVLFTIIAFLLIILIVFITGMTVHFRNDQIIKGGNNEL